MSSEAINFFDMIAEAQTPAPVKRKLDAAEKRARAKAQAEQELKDEQLLSKLYQRWKKQKRDALLDGPHGKDVRGIVSFLDTMSLSSAPALIKTIERARWIETMAVSDRHTLLGIVSAGIVRCREKAGLPPFDDEIAWCEPPKAYSQIKTLMRLDGL
ncbi:UNVERIFIED_ORG: hypothetical protein M2438_002686 [Methylobacterium sp. SuP10 SLI 274]|uniref:hypothetical protein n=1 Tax=Methylorubrum extorquens TaxID=408 RepID=UPI0020A0B891|nr:hypothetical protein [Methylorubrum extorquens]MDF9863918.1 hypothetical protein [Methylorubrum pseudosasae]MDH6637511.1 hypothetical protein [Methylobacterium sp. SuP10 SLI 274]MDH6666691.1 hypothetical protein [Methylorubrum zatmanii]MCP1558599.1 hypothetical protein [Methylorubrum extorquens]MDF9792228.1 hypothetical protein [Methylorubrum extorquens]